MPTPVEHPKTVRDEFKRFVTFSTIRGVPRTLRARSRAWGFVWLISVLLFCSISLYFIIQLVIQYNDFQTIFQTKYHFRSNDVPFPSVTICNLQPFSSNMISRIQNNTRNNTKDQYLLQKLENMKTLDSSGNFQSLSTKSFLLQNWDAELIELHGLKFDEFVLPNTCNYSILQNDKLKSESCARHNIRMIPNAHLFQCFMISANRDVSNQTYSLEMDIYLDNEDSLCHTSGKCNRYLYGLEDSIGAHVVVHAAETYPHIMQQGIHIHPGTKTTIEVTESRMEILDKELGECTEIKDMPLLISNRTMNFAYMTTVCQSLEIQKKVAGQCYCIDPEYPIHPNMENLEYCAQLRADGSLLNYTCSSTAENLTPVKAFDECKKSCRYIAYKTTTFQSMWPPKINELDLYKLRIQKNKQLFGDKFILYEEALLELENGNVSNAWKILRNTDIIKENFVRLRVFRPDTSLTETEEKLQISREALISQIGGALSLWCGVTVITLVELLEFLYYVGKKTTVKILSRSQRKTKEEDKQDHNHVHLAIANPAFYDIRPPIDPKA